MHTIDARHLNLITGGTDSERSDTYDITMAPQVSTEELVDEYTQIRSFIIRNRAFPTSTSRAKLPVMRRRAKEIYLILQERGYTISF